MNVRRLARVWIPPLARVHPGTRPPRMRPPFHGGRRMRGSCHIALLTLPPSCALAHPTPIAAAIAPTLPDRSAWHESGSAP